MTDTTCISEFYQFNNDDVVRIFSHKIYNSESVPDLVQNFYVRLIDRSSLDKYDPQKGPYDSYVMMLIDHTISDSIPRRKDSTCATILPEDNFDEHKDKISDFRSWIDRYGGKHRAVLYRELQLRINGDCRDSPGRKLYAQHVRRFLSE